MNTPEPSPPTRPGPASDPTVRAGSGARPSPLAPPPDIASADPSSRFGKFVRTLRLGSGGMGEVWKAWDTQLSRWVALKFLKGSDDAEIERFEREAQLAARLSHPHIAAIYEVGHDQGRHWIAMQFIDGATLRGHSRADLRAIVDLVRDAARAVAVANDAGIIHRDLKPENLMVTRAGRAAHVYVMDFGLARATEGASDLSVSGSIVGTPAYMPPEQARGQKADARADVWSLGATLYELLSGKKPFAGANVYETLRLVQEADPIPPARLSRQIDADLETIVLKCLEKDPSRRYSTTSELADDLTRWLKGEAILAHAPSVAYRMRKFARRNRAVLFPTVVAVLIGAFSLGWWLTGQAGRARQVRALLGEARAFEADGDLPAARDRFARAATLDATNGEARDGAARVDALKADADKLVEVGRSAIDRAELYLREPRAKYDELVRRVDEGQARLEEAVRKAPRLAVAHLHLGRSWSLKGWPDKAEGCWRAALALDPSLGAAHFHLGRLLLSRTFLVNISDSDDPNLAGRAAGEHHAKEAAAQFALAMQAGTGFDDDLLRHVGTAMLALAQRRIDDMRRLLAEGVQRFKDRDGEEELWFFLGLATHDPTESLAALDRALFIRPNYPEALFLRAVRRSAGDPQAAVDDVTRALHFCPRLDFAWFLRGRCLESLGQLTAAIADYDEALRLRPAWPLIHSARGACHVAGGNLDAARRDIDEALRLDPSSPHGSYQRIELLQKSGDLDGAIAEADRGVAIDPGNAERFQRRGNLHFSRNDFARARRDYEDAIRLEPRHAFAHGNLALVQFATGDREAAIASMGRAIDTDARNAENWIRRAAMKLEMGDVDGAIADATGAIRIDSSRRDTYRLRSEAREKKGDLEGARADAAMAGSPVRAPSQAAVEEGVRLYQMGDVAGAYAEFERALKLDPRNIEAIRNHAAIRILRGENDAAIAECDAGLRIRPGTPTLLYHRGYAKFSKGDDDGAWADVEAALRADPDHVDSLNLHGFLRGKRGDLTGAIVELRRATTLDPKNTKSWDNLAIASGVAKDWDAAIGALTKLIALLPTDPDVVYRRAGMKQAKGDLPGCADDVEEALRLAPKNWPSRAQAETALRQLRGQ